MGKCKELLSKHNMKIRYINSKRGVNIVERDHLIAEKHLFFMQVAVEMKLPPDERCKSWVKYLRVKDKKFNNSPIQD